jgi:hypothetical protein
LSIPLKRPDLCQLSIFQFHFASIFYLPFKRKLNKYLFFLTYRSAFFSVIHFTFFCFAFLLRLALFNLHFRLESAGLLRCETIQTSEVNSSVSIGSETISLGFSLQLETDSTLYVDNVRIHFVSDSPCQTTIGLVQQVTIGHLFARAIKIKTHDRIWQMVYAQDSVGMFQDEK